MEFFKDLVRFLLVRKKFWLIPMILILLIIGGILVFATNSAAAPFIYTLF